MLKSIIALLLIACSLSGCGENTSERDPSDLDKVVHAPTEEKDGAIPKDRL